MLKLWKTSRWDCLLGIDYIMHDEAVLTDYNFFDLIEGTSQDIRIRFGDRRLDLNNVLEMVSKNGKISTVKNVRNRDFSIDIQELPYVLPIVSKSCMPLWHIGNRGKDIQNMFPSQGTFIMAMVSSNSTLFYLVKLFKQPDITEGMYCQSFFGFYAFLLEELNRCSTSMQLIDEMQVLNVETDCLHIMVENPVTLSENEPDLSVVNKILRSNLGIQDICIHGGNDLLLDIFFDNIQDLPNLRKIYYIGELLDIMGWIAVAKLIYRMNVKNLILSQRLDMVDDGVDLDYHEKVVNATSFIFQPSIEKFWGALSSEYLCYDEKFQISVCQKMNVDREELLQLIYTSKIFIQDNYFKLTGVVRDRIIRSSENRKTVTLAELPNEVLRRISSMLALDDVEREIM